jgi:uncharacterized membrane protein YfcA
VQVELDATFFALAVPAVFIAGASKGGFGSGAAFMASPLLALVIEPALAVALMLPLLMLMDVTSLRTYWRQWSWPQSRQLMIGAVPGVVLGMLFFRVVSADGLRLLVGGIALGFVGFQLARGRGWISPAAAFAAPIWGKFWGLVAGFTSFVSHAGGPPAAMYLLASKLDKTSYQASTVIVFWWVNLIKLPPYYALGMFTAETFTANLILAPVAVIGVLAGVWAHRRISPAMFFGLTYTLLAATGAKLVFDALT